MNELSLRTRPTVLEPQTFDQLITFADMAAKTDFVPKQFQNKPGAIMLAVQWGAELGMPPMQALNSIAVINGRPGIWGDGLIGLCRQSPLCQDIIETIEGEGEGRTATCTAVRRNATPVTAKFSIADAKRAGLLSKDLYKQYPDRMIQNRARGFALRDAFPDVLRGMKTAEELYDTPPDPFVGATLDARPEPIVLPPSPPGAADRAAAAKVPKRTYRQIVDEVRQKLAGFTDRDDVVALADEAHVKYALEHANAEVKQELKDLLADAYGRFAEQAEAAAPSHDDAFPGDTR
jgi:hypothetical protein